jgi:hypothetical protein
MPLNDEIFLRLAAATISELQLIAASLGEQEALTRTETINSLSKAFRSTGGNSFENIFRDDHELPYVEVLRDVCATVGGRLNSSTAIRVPPQASVQAMEDFISEVSFRAQDPTLTDDAARGAALRAIEMRVFDLPPPQPAPPPTRTVPPIVRNAVQSTVGAAIWSLGASILVPVAVGAAAVAAVAYASSPTMDKVVPATIVLIQIRKRQEAEAMLARSVGDDN